MRHVMLRPDIGCVRLQVRMTGTLQQIPEARNTSLS